MCASCLSDKHAQKVGRKEGRKERKEGKGDNLMLSSIYIYRIAYLLTRH
jgi:hypothetical protein